MNRKERDRLRLIHEVERGHIASKDGAVILRISERQMKRIRKRWREEGDSGLAHKRRGTPSNRRIPDSVMQRAVDLIRGKYPDFKPTFASEKLELDGICVSEETVRKWMIEAGLWKPRKKREHHRERRERRERFGEMIQVDGSLHDWLEGRGPRMTLIAMIDDATSEVVLRFAPAEGFPSVMATMRLWLEKHGRPLSIYADRHSIWVAKAGEPGERDELDTTQLRRALRDLDIEFIAARSPQAKGRVERLFETLQDRLVKELRLAGIDNMDDANRFLEETYLPWHNQRFRLEPASKANAHRRLGRGFDLDLILSGHEERTVANDYTLRWRNRFFQIHKPVPTGLRGARATVADLADGSLRIVFRGRDLNWEEISKSIHVSTSCHTSPRGSMDEAPSPKPPPRPSKPWIPPPDHPWRKSLLKIR